MSPTFHTRVGISMIKWVVTSLTVLTAVTTAIAYMNTQVNILQATTKELQEIKSLQIEKDKQQDEQLRKNNDDILVIKSDLKYIIKILEKK